MAEEAQNRNHKTCINLSYPMFQTFIDYLQVTIMARQRFRIDNKMKLIYNEILTKDENEPL